MQIPLISLYWPSIIQIVDHKNDEPMHQPCIIHILLPFQKKYLLHSDFFFKGSKIGLMLGWCIGSFQMVPKVLVNSYF